MYCAKTDSWYLERVIWLVAGTVVLTGTALAAFVNLWWLVLPALAGVNLVVYSLSGFCLMANILVKLGLRSRVT